MIDFDDMRNRQVEGEKQVDSLLEHESTALQIYCSLATEVVMKMGIERQATADLMIMNAFKNGIALGLRLQVVEGEIQGRL